MDNTKSMHRYLLQNKIAYLQQEIKATFDLINDYEFESINDLFPEEWKNKEYFIDILTWSLNTRK